MSDDRVHCVVVTTDVGKPLHSNTKVTEGTKGIAETKGAEGIKGSEETNGAEGTKGPKGTKGREGTKGTEGTIKIESDGSRIAVVDTAALISQASIEAVCQHEG
jgi:hypothetical protein